MALHDVASSILPQRFFRTQRLAAQADSPRHVGTHDARQLLTQPPARQDAQLRVRVQVLEPGRLY